MSQKSREFSVEFKNYGDGFGLHPIVETRISVTVR